MDERNAEDPSRKWFLWGIALAWIPSFPLIVGFLNTFRGISEQKATGLGAVAGGLAETYLTFGIIVTLVSELAAIVLLIRSFSRGHLRRGSVAVLSICWSILMLLLFALFVWMFLVYLPHVTATPR
jgi:ACR3 family arsenite efflux pump ArsB